MKHIPALTLGDARAIGAAAEAEALAKGGEIKLVGARAPACPWHAGGPGRAPGRRQSGAEENMIMGHLRPPLADLRQKQVKLRQTNRER